MTFRLEVDGIMFWQPFKFLTLKDGLPYIISLKILYTRLECIFNYNIKWKGRGIVKVTEIKIQKYYYCQSYCIVFCMGHTHAHTHTYIYGYNTFASCRRLCYIILTLIS
jgi:hypothetical protein